MGRELEPEHVGGDGEHGDRRHCERRAGDRREPGVRELLAEELVAVDRKVLALQLENEPVHRGENAAIVIALRENRDGLGVDDRPSCSRLRLCLNGYDLASDLLDVGHPALLKMHAIQHEVLSPGGNLTSVHVVAYLEVVDVGGLINLDLASRMRGRQGSRDGMLVVR
eukprot:CAMPEP_0179981220 /NCGR_PEP_ID=MMETSP0983-20121128/42397_1 /TAXON_ID=483367 /ORGANISM="non described non described, Strain CCMP 2436" /LENGTH=167 /DNA_ID=CAMNT_0021899301 /DNA_START=300 /DNA_END=800 /DNA_ORIENTATION=+